jgi:hypothetical protein
VVAPLCCLLLQHTKCISFVEGRVLSLYATSERTSDDANTTDRMADALLKRCWIQQVKEFGLGLEGNCTFVNRMAE